MASKVLILFFTSLLSLSNVTTPQVAEVPQIREESTAPTVSEDSTGYYQLLLQKGHKKMTFKFL